MYKMALSLFFAIWSLMAIMISVQALDKARDCQCRISAYNRIVGGNVAPTQSFPWQASLGSLKLDPKKPSDEKNKMATHYCGAMILNEEWILTAAHCVVDPMHITSGRAPETIAVGVGNDHDIVKMFDHGRLIAKKVIIKPGYFAFSASSPNDLALIQLANPLQLNQTVNPACLLNRNLSPYPSKLVATGWGSTNRMVVSIISHQWSGYEASRFLKEADFDDSSLTTSSCSLRPDLICISPSEGEEKSSCKGDSGGPLHFTEKGKTYVVGVTSFGPAKVKEMYKYETCIGTSAYTRINSHLSWIKEHLGDNLCEFD